MDFYQGVVFLLAKFDKSSPSVNRDREIVKATWLWGNDVNTSWTGVLLRFIVCPNLMFLVSPWLDIYIYIYIYIYFQTGHFTTLGKLKLILLVYFYKLWTCHSYYTEFGQDIRPQKKSLPSLFDKKPCIGSSTSHFQ